MHKGSVHDLITRKADNLPMSIRMKMALDTAKGMYVILIPHCFAPLEYGSRATIGRSCTRKN